MKYDLFLFDADDTLFDFQASERLSFQKAMQELNLSQNIDPIFESYRSVSAKLWKMLEQAQTTKEILKVERFRSTFAAHGIEVDPAMASEVYLEHLSQTVVLVDHAFDICEFLSQRGEIGIITNGIETVQTRRLQKSLLKPFISFMTVSESCGFAKPDVRFFDQVTLHARRFQKSTSLVIGDRMETDIEGAHNFGLDACLYNPQKLSWSHHIRPKFEINHLSQLKDVVQ